MMLTLFVAVLCPELKHEEEEEDPFGFEESAEPVRASGRVSVFNRRSVCLTEDEGGLGEADETVLLQPGAEIEVRSLQTQNVRRSLFDLFSCSNLG